MENENIENPNSENGNTEFDNLDSDALKEKAQELNTKLEEIEQKNRQLFERAKKAEGFEQDPDDPQNWIKVVDKKETKKKPEVTPEKSGEIDYGLLSFFNDKSETKITHDDDVEFLKKELESSGKPMMELLNNKYFLNDLKERQDERTVKEATPSSTSRSSPSTKDVGYWKNQPYDKVPEHMKHAVLDAIKEDQQRAQHI